MRRRTWLGVLGLLVLLVLGLVGGCALFNQTPIARIVASTLSGASPLTVNFDASESTDSDGVIVGWLWDFGDGSDTVTGETARHTFVSLSETSRFTVTLTVTDDDRAKSQVSQTIEVLVGGDIEEDGEGLPVARFTRDKIIGLIPLTVTFNASDSTGGEGDIIAYDWDFGDGAIASGNPVTHTFEPERTEEFTVTLTVWTDEGVFDWGQEVVIVIVPADETGDEEPTAEIFFEDPEMIYESDERPNIPSLFEVTFDPGGSYADAGHEIEYYLWEFGDGEIHIEESDLTVTHIYELRTLTRTYATRLTVYDDQGLEGTETVNVTLTDEYGEDEEEED